MRLDAVTAELDRHLDKGAEAPLLVAVSGGGDSLALLLLAREWAQKACRRLVAATVNHGLNPDAAAWVDVCAARAAALGVAHRALAWNGAKPTTGLPAAARAARHALLADCARAEGAAVVLMGHTADDLAEAAAMRAAGSSTPSPRAWAPSPAWPEGRGVFVLRPMLAARRAELRAWLAERGETWIDDPANDDPRFARARARAAGAPPVPLAEPIPLPCASWRYGVAGEIHVARQAPRRLLGAAIASAAGLAGAPPAGRTTALHARLATGADFTATLGGARITARGEAITITREAGEFTRRGVSALPAAAGQAVVWDGRFEIEAHEPCVIQPLAGLATRLEKAQVRALKDVPAAARGALPALVSADGAVRCPILAQGRDDRVVNLVPMRLAAAAGVIGDEASFWRVAKTAAAS